MNRLFLLCGCVLALAVFAVSAAEDKKGEKAPTLKAIMKASFGGKENLRTKVGAAIKAEEWDKAGKLAAEWEKLAHALPKTKPNKGDAESWAKKTATFEKTITTLNAGIKDKDAKKANGALGALGGSCKSCHDEHRGK